MGPRRVGLALLLAAFPARAQLDLGSHGIPQDSIDAYIAPFHRLLGAGLGSDRHLPMGRPGAGIAWHAGLQGGAVPVPDGKPFSEAGISLLPLFRLEGGLGWRAAGAMARGLAWSDPGLGDLSTWGGALSLGHGFPIGLPGGRKGVAAGALVAAWDHFDFSSEYTYRYRGSLLNLLDQDIPGDYTVSENLTAAGLQGAFGIGRWTLHAGATLEWTSGRFRYLYLDPRDGRQSRVASDFDEAGLRLESGLGWRGFRLRAGWRDFPYLALGWAWIR